MLLSLAEFKANAGRITGARVCVRPAEPDGRSAASDSSSPIYAILLSQTAEFSCFHGLPDASSARLLTGRGV